MAQVTFFQYMQKDTVLHRMDSRLKLPCLLFVGAAASRAGKWQHYAILFCLLCAALFAAKIPIAAIIKELKVFALLLCIVFVSNAVFSGSDPVWYLPDTWVSMQGIAAGARFVGRLILMILACTVMTNTTSLIEFRNTIEWYLRPVPFVPEVKVATIVNLTFVMLPVIFDSYTEMMDAQKSRGIECQKNPIKRVKYLVLPLLGKTLRRADEIVYAMESRCYSQTRTKAQFHTGKADWLLFIACALALCIVLFF